MLTIKLMRGDDVLHTSILFSSMTTILQIHSYKSHTKLQSFPRYWLSEENYKSKELSGFV